ncbi:hypothetical protein [Butyrivibrio sp. AE3006]|uniref:hypothetical protein n=1 Tax=Butyrivibrio sp. AE3006 TaxID=1280673 RepID=UPI000418EAEF|nr:hypothetical protein [Butyrivibrio sp. AE3006]
MKTKIIHEKQDLTYLKWSHIRSSSGTAGTFLKSQSTIGGSKIYYKLSNFDSEKGVIGHECINEIIVDRLLTLLGVEHLSYNLINATIEIEGRTFDTYLCASEDFKNRGESKIALDDYFRTNALPGESHYEFCARNGFKDYIDEMIAIDFIILNRDRHGANIEILRDARNHTLRIAPLFDHGLSLLYSCTTDKTAAAFDIMEDRRCQNFIGSGSCFENLNLIKNRDYIFKNQLTESDKTYIFEGLYGILSDVFIDKIWAMIYERYLIYENL